MAAIVASTLHLLVVRPTATAFFASLTAEQRRLRWQAKMHSYRVAAAGAALGCLVVLCWRPYTKIEWS